MEQNRGAFRVRRRWIDVRGEDRITAFVPRPSLEGPVRRRCELADLEIGTAGDRIGLTLVERVDEGQAAGDALFLVEVESSASDCRFTGRAHCWVEGVALSSFLADLRRVDEERRGSATLASGSPGELQLTLGIVDLAGHLAAFGRVGHRMPSAFSDSQWSSIAFEIELDPTSLPGLVKKFAGLASGRG